MKACVSLAPWNVSIAEAGFIPGPVVDVCVVMMVEPHECPQVMCERILDEHIVNIREHNVHIAGLHDIKNDFELAACEGIELACSESILSQAREYMRGPYYTAVRVEALVNCLVHGNDTELQPVMLRIVQINIILNQITCYR